jgi:hypothetical protein
MLGCRASVSRFVRATDLLTKFMPRPSLRPVRDLKEKLSKHDDKTRAVVSWEQENHQHLFEIDAISLAQGKSFRDARGKAGFAFDQNGSEKWLFIEVDLA